MNASLTSMLRQLTLVLLLAAIPPFFAMPCTALAAGGQRGRSEGREQEGAISLF